MRGLHRVDDERQLTTTHLSACESSKVYLAVQTRGEASSSFPQRAPKGALPEWRGGSG